MSIYAYIFFKQGIREKGPPLSREYVLQHAFHKDYAGRIKTAGLCQSQPIIVKRSARGLGKIAAKIKQPELIYEQAHIANTCQDKVDLVDIEHLSFRNWLDRRKECPLNPAGCQFRKHEFIMVAVAIIKGKPAGVIGKRF